MALNKIFNLIVVLFLAQNIFCRPADYSSSELNAAIDEVRTDAKGSDVLLVFTIENFYKIPKQYSLDAVNVCEKILQDETLPKDSTKPVIAEFRTKLSTIVEDFNQDKGIIKLIFKPMVHFHTLTNYYYHLAEGQKTEDVKFIIDLLNKYDSKTVAVDLYTDHLETFFENFKKKFEEHKNDMEKPVLDWYEKFLTIKDKEDKILSILEFIDLA